MSYFHSIIKWLSIFIITGPGTSVPLKHLCVNRLHNVLFRYTNVGSSCVCHLQRSLYNFTLCHKQSKLFTLFLYVTDSWQSNLDEAITSLQLSPVSVFLIFKFLRNCKGTCFLLPAIPGLFSFGSFKGINYNSLVGVVMSRQPKRKSWDQDAHRKLQNS